MDGDRWKCKYEKRNSGKVYDKVRRNFYSSDKESDKKLEADEPYTANQHKKRSQLGVVLQKLPENVYEGSCGCV